jgi:DNA-binding transcriptional MerR regulator
MPKTVSEIAQQVKPGASETERNVLVERIAHWTREHLIAPLGRQNPGTGRHRRYADAAVVDVMILDAMANMGVPIETMRFTIFQVRESLRTGEWREKPFLEIDRFPGGQLAAYLTPADALMKPLAIEGAHIFDLRNLFAAITTPPPQQTGDVVREQGK